MNVARLVGTTLAGLGAEAVFGVVGSGNFEVTNALRSAGVAFTAARHEGGAATMADAYARVSGKLALVSVHQGCGLTNALTGIGEAAKSRTPLLVLAADTAGSAVRSNFRVDQDAAVTAVGAVAERVHSAESASADILRAYRKAVHERRTVVLNLPLDVQAQQVVEEHEVTRPVPPLPVRPHPSAVAELAGVLAEAERPVFVAGRGALAAGGELAGLAAKCGALLATSAVANGLFTEDPWSLGISGGFASPLAVELISGADLVVGWGCALNMWTMRQGSLIGSGTKVAQIDDDASALGAHRPVDLGVVGDVALTARDVAAGARERAGYREPWIARRIAEHGRWRTESYVDLSSDERIDPRTLSIALDDLLPSERLVAVDSGNFMGYPSAYLSVPDEAGFCFTQAFQSIGLGLATAIGAALARPDRLPVAALGDGGALMAAAELETVARLGLPMVLVVYNDAAYGAEVHHFGEGADLGAVRFPDTDLAAVARGYGLSGITVRSVADLAGLRDWLDGARDRALLVDAKIASDGGSWWLAEAFKGH
ncbi:acetolactate synthase [Prauserella marina]|uniref:Acetolactate synthase large subunit n=1 Tax=Prauserella marina TaxID=530584 RepID=A0A222VMB1_9PSEU|nr:thiamine pyrophosphate-binding protein [Prauserella marina]ASR34982.1 acetolactate synthase [Prauserella marina]PWV85294.1 thiamine pyrophosphate-dependent acetolactate synthase large subunit-like protein [Prauserella marina]SDC00359.1 Acetolactate synthase large subunit [Prauserella marina]